MSIPNIVVIITQLMSLGWMFGWFFVFTLIKNNDLKYQKSLGVIWMVALVAALTRLITCTFFETTFQVKWLDWILPLLCAFNYSSAMSKYDAHLRALREENGGRVG